MQYSRAIANAIFYRIASNTVLILVTQVKTASNRKKAALLSELNNFVCIYTIYYIDVVVYNKHMFFFHMQSVHCTRILYLTLSHSCWWSYMCFFYCRVANQPFLTCKQTNFRIFLTKHLRLRNIFPSTSLYIYIYSNNMQISVAQLWLWV